MIKQQSHGCYRSGNKFSIWLGNSFKFLVHIWEYRSRNFNLRLLHLFTINNNCYQYCLQISNGYKWKLFSTLTNNNKCLLLTLFSGRRKSWQIIFVFSMDDISCINRLLLEIAVIHCTDCWLMLINVLHNVCIFQGGLTRHFLIVWPC